MSGEDLPLEGLISENDEKVIRKLQTTETAILDEVCEYHLNRVGCNTTDVTVIRLAALAVQLSLEKILDDAKLVNAYKREELNPSSQKRTTDTKELDMDSLCTAFQKNDDKHIGVNYDLFLEVPPNETNSNPN